MMQRRGRGFTLIELMIALAIVAILAAIALPSYRKSVQKSNRGVGKAFLVQLMSREESFFADRKTYSTTIAPMGFPAETLYLDKTGNVSTSSATDPIYIVTVCTTGSCAAATTSLVWFQAAPTGVQNSPADGCGTLIISTSGTKTQTGTLGALCWKS